MRKYVAALLLAALAPLVSGCAGPQKRQYEFYGAFDTVIRLTAYTRDEASFQRICERAEAEFVRLDAIFDRYEAHDGVSGVWALNHAQGASIAVEPELIDLLTRAQELYAVCDRVNIAMGAVLELWHDARESGRLPDAQALRTAAGHSDFSMVVVDPQAGTVQLKDPLMKLDLGAIAKGYAADRVAKLLGEENLLIDAGGNIVALGSPGDGRAAWDIGISLPEGGTLSIVEVSDGCAATSGGSVRYFLLDGIRYHHIIDPDTLYPADFFRQVTVFCDSAFLADWLSTSAFLLPLEESQALIEAAGARGVWILPDGEIVQ